MQFFLLSFTTAVRNMAASAQAAASMVLDFTVGSPYRALLEATGSLLMWLQWLILQVLSLTRAATSNGSDLDSWMADFSLTRLAATFATGHATFSRFSATSTALILPGTLVKTSDGSQSFAVTIDTTNSAWNAGLGGYFVGIIVTSVTLPVQAVTAGTGGNIQANTLTLLATAVPGIDTVTNAASFINGVNAEGDAAFRIRFANYIASLREANLAAFNYAVGTVPNVTYFQILENYDHSLTYTPGLVSICIDDGSGSPPSTLLAAVTTAVDAIRALTVRFNVFGPTIFIVNVGMTLTTAPGFVHLAVVSQVILALTNEISLSPIGAGLSYTFVASIAYQIPGVLNVTGITVNSGTADIAAASFQRLTPGTLTVA